MTYISVPYTAWESVGESPLRTTAIAKAPYPEGEGVGGGASLGSLSINDTPTITPSEMAWKSYRNCSNEIKGKYGKLLTDFCRYMEMCDNSGFSAEGIAVGCKCKPYYKNTVKVVNYTTESVVYQNRSHRITILASVRYRDRCLTDGTQSGEPHG